MTDKLSISVDALTKLVAWIERHPDNVTDFKITLQPPSPSDSNRKETKP